MFIINKLWRKYEITDFSLSIRIVDFAISINLVFLSYKFSTRCGTSIRLLSFSFSILFMFFPSQICHFVCFLLLFKLIVVLLLWLLSCLANSFLFLQFLLLSFLFFIFNRVQPLNQCSYFSLLIWTEKSWHLFTFSSSNLLLFAFLDFVCSFERKLSLQLFRKHERIKDLGSSVNCGVLWIGIFFNLNSFLDS